LGSLLICGGVLIGEEEKIASVWAIWGGEGRGIGKTAHLLEKTEITKGGAIPITQTKRGAM